MNREKAIITLASVWLVAFVCLVYAWINDSKERADIATAFATGNYLSTNGVVNVYADYGNKYLSEEEKEDIITKLADAIGINGELEFQSKRDGESGKYTGTISFSTFNNSSSTDIRIVTMENEATEGVVYLEQYILMELSIDNSIESAIYYKEKIEEEFEKLNIAADVNLNLKGCVQGPLSNAKKNEICENIIEELEGELVIGGENDDIYTVYAYSRNIKEYVINGSVKSNINIMITYDKEKDLSWISVGSPIID